MRLKDALFRNMKSTFPTGSSLREQLLSGFVVACLRGRPDDEDFDALLEENAFKDIWLHVGLLYLSPYQPTFMLLKHQASAGSSGSNTRCYVEVA